MNEQLRVEAWQSALKPAGTGKRASLSPQRALAFPVSVLGVALLLLLHTDLVGLGLTPLANIATGVAAVALALVLPLSRRGLWSLPAVYLFVFALFHLGVVTLYGLRLLSGEMNEARWVWLFGPTTNEAIWLTLLGIAAFTAGCGLAAWTRGISPEVAGGRVPSSRVMAENSMYSIVGCSVVVSSVAFWFVSVLITGGPSLLVSSYGEYLAATASQGGAFALSWFGMGLGWVFLAVASVGRRHVIALLAFALFVLVALPLGLRGEVLFPTLAAATIFARRGRRLSAIRTVAVVIAVLTVIAVVKDVRQVGLAEIAEGGFGTSPLDGVAELGATLRPVTVVVGWRTGGDPLILGQSYWAPVERAMAAVIPGGSSMPANQDYRLMNVLVQQRVGPIGFSPVAEAYRNFGVAGPIGVMMLFGWLLSFLDHWAITRTRQAVAGLILVQLLINVRNAFVPVPAQLLLGFSLILLVVSLVSAAIPAERLGTESSARFRA